MKLDILLFEDEQLTAERLVQLLGKLDHDLTVLDVLSSVKQGVKWFKSKKTPDLILMDIHLSDGSCFELFDQVKIEAPVIFTTAYDEYAIKAFKVNSVDYILKPIDFKELSSAFEKFKKYRNEILPGQSQFFQSLYQQLSREGNYKQRFLVKLGDQLKRVETKNIAYFIYQDGLVWVQANAKNKLPIDYSLEQLETMLDPKSFFRVNRKMVVNLNAVERIHTYFNSRLKLKLIPDPGEDVIVSRERVNEFKAWLE